MRFLSSLLIIVYQSQVIKSFHSTGLVASRTGPGTRQHISVLFALEENVVKALDIKVTAMMRHDLIYFFLFFKYIFYKFTLFPFIGLTRGYEI